MTIPDHGSYSRNHSFKHDPFVKRSCQQISQGTYKGGTKTDRGHLVPANHLDFNAGAIKNSNLMTNILPQVAVMNRGAWLKTEEITECYRDIVNLTVIGGIVWTKPRGDDFIETHGVETPKSFWKVLIVGRTVPLSQRPSWAKNRRHKPPPTQAIAWLIPNDKASLKRNINQFVITWDQLKTKLGDNLGAVNITSLPPPSSLIPAPNRRLESLSWADKNWPSLKGCNLG